MSAPKSGRQSPPPSEQDPAQGSSAPSSGKASDVNEQAGSRDTKSESENQLEGLDSNPTTGIDKKADMSISKDGRGGT